MIDATLRIVEVHTVPIWEEPTGMRRPPQPDEERDDLPCVGWANAAVMDLAGERRWFLLVYTGE